MAAEYDPKAEHEKHQKRKARAAAEEKGLGFVYVVAECDGDGDIRYEMYDVKEDADARAEWVENSIRGKAVGRGHFVLTVRDKDADEIEFTTFDSERERREYYASIKRWWIKVQGEVELSGYISPIHSFIQRE